MVLSKNVLSKNSTCVDKCRLRVDRILSDPTTQNEANFPQAVVISSAHIQNNFEPFAGPGEIGFVCIPSSWQTQSLTHPDRHDSFQLNRTRMFRVFIFGALAMLLARTNAAAQTPTTPRAILDQYCVTCHNQKLKTAGLLLDRMDPSHVASEREAWEKVVRKLRAGMMPPAGLPRPPAAAYESLTVALENELDRAAATRPKLAAAGFHRMNRTEYADAIHNLLALDIDAAQYLPADDSSYGFDNVASGLNVSPALVEGYVTAATKISRLALGHETEPGRKVYHVREDYSQEDHIDGLSFGTRGGMLIHHYFPADGEYEISWIPVRTSVSGLYGGDSEDEQLELTVDGERIKLFKMGADVPISTNHDKNEVRVNVKAGPRTIGLAFIATTYVPSVDLNHHYRRSILDDNIIDGFTFTPQVSSVTVAGPYNGKPAADSPSRRKVLACRPANASEEVPCARRVLTALAKQAYRRPLTDSDTEKLLSFY
jgi:hypothetical protein